LFQPLLPEPFWAIFDSSITAPNSPIELNLEALEKAFHQANVRAAEQSALRQTIESRFPIVVSFCGGCGFARQAEDFSRKLEEAVSVRAGLIKDATITGRFDISIKSPDGTFAVVHSKKQGDGFVDSDEKMQSILKVLKNLGWISGIPCSLPSAAQPITKLARTIDGSKEEADEKYRSRLSSASFQVLREKATEPRHSVKRTNGGFDDVFDDGVYACLACRTPLYTSDMKYDCGCGWPGFWTNIDGSVRAVQDSDGRRHELVCNACNSHLGHVFFGEGHGHPTDERHCVNSCSLTFLPQGSTQWQDCTYVGRVIGTGSGLCVYIRPCRVHGAQ
jgi:peptide-methionine (R)-S-oxide reductase